jgi:hypothetical protein
MITITIIELGVFAVHYEVVFCPESFSRYYIGESDIVEMNAIDLRKICNAAIQPGEKLVYFLSAGA